MGVLDADGAGIAEAALAGPFALDGDGSGAAVQAASAEAAEPPPSLSQRHRLAPDPANRRLLVHDDMLRQR